MLVLQVAGSHTSLEVSRSSQTLHVPWKRPVASRQIWDASGSQQPEEQPNIQVPVIQQCTSNSKNINEVAQITRPVVNVRPPILPATRNVPYESNFFTIPIPKDQYKPNPFDEYVEFAIGEVLGIRVIDVLAGTVTFNGENKLDFVPWKYRICRLCIWVCHHQLLK